LDYAVSRDQQQPFAPNRQQGDTAPHSTYLTIVSIAIRQDEHGRFCLNDLHKAAGGEKRHQASDWLRQAQTGEMVAALSNSGKSRIKPVEAKAGRYGGTFAVKTLVYAYAMWISADFHIAVIDAYDQMVTSGRPAAAPSHDLSTMPRSQMLDHFPPAKSVKPLTHGASCKKLFIQLFALNEQWSILA